MVAVPRPNSACLYAPRCCSSTLIQVLSKRFTEPDRRALSTAPEIMPTIVDWRCDRTEFRMFVRAEFLLQHLDPGFIEALHRTRSPGVVDRAGDHADDRRLAL